MVIPPVLTGTCPYPRTGIRLLCRVRPRKHRKHLFLPFPCRVIVVSSCTSTVAYTEITGCDILTVSFFVRHPGFQSTWLDNHFCRSCREGKWFLTDGAVCITVPIETIMETDNDKDMMTTQVAPRVRKEHPTKKSSAKQATGDDKIKNILYALSEHSLSGFLDDEPDLYSVSDLKVRYR
jgi:hypothetical protein